jgi:hypothetical protein
MQGAAAAEGMLSAVVPGEDSTEPMPARAAVAVAPAWGLAEAAVVVWVEAAAVVAVGEA